MPAEPEVWVVILNYQQPQLALKAVRSILGSDYKNIRLVLVDNASQDNSVDFLKRELSGATVTYLENPANQGFAAGNNPAIKLALEAHAPYVMLLNSDAMVFPETISRLVATMERHGEVGACTARGYFALDRKEPIHCAYATDPSPWGALLAAILPVNFMCRLLGARLRTMITGEHIDVGRSCAVNWFHGALMLVRRQAIADAGLLDENFFLFFEEIDWCIRMRKHGWKIYYDASAEYVHLMGGSSGGERLTGRGEQVRNISIRSRRYFMRKHYGRVRGFIFTVIDRLILQPAESLRRALKPAVTQTRRAA